MWYEDLNQKLCIPLNQMLQYTHCNPVVDYIIGLLADVVEENKHQCTWNQDDE